MRGEDGGVVVLFGVDLSGIEIRLLVFLWLVEYLRGGMCGGLGCRETASGGGGGADGWGYFLEMVEAPWVGLFCSGMLEDWNYLLWGMSGLGYRFQPHSGHLGDCWIVRPLRL